MLPWGHAAVGYLLYSFVARLRDRFPLDGWAVVALGLGTQFPDLVDKPLAWSFAVLPTGRSLMHSALTMTLVGAVLLYVAHRRNRETVAWAFLAGYASHLVADAVAPLSRGDVHEIHYVVYPLLPLPEPEHDYSFIDFFLTLELTPLTTLGLVLTGVALVQWHRDGHPGLAVLRGVTGRLRGSDDPNQQ
jgi:hypothetical protein